jgi:hypothetical protein
MKKLKARKKFIVSLETQHLEKQNCIYISNLNPIEFWLAEGDILAVFIRTPDYSIFSVRNAKFPHLQNHILCLPEQFA